MIFPSLILIYNYSELPESFNLIFKMAFNPPAQIAGAVGGGF
jgi:Na+/alanine symporter